MSAVTPRPDQVQWIGGISSAFRRSRRVCGVACTGFGKTVSFAEMTRRTVDRGGSVVLVAHRIEIVDQICRALRRAGVGFDRIEGGRRTSNARVLVGMVQTVANRIEHLRKPTLLVVDECHHATAGSYRKITDAWPDVFVLGVTATPQRTDGTGLGAVFEELVEGPPMADLIARGFLAGYRYLAPPAQVDLSRVKSRAGDYAQDELAKAMNSRAITGDAIAHYVKFLNGQPAIAFCVSVEHAEAVAQQFREAGCRAESVDGTTDPRIRADRIAAIGDGRLHVLTSCELISEGTDIPAVSGALLLRPTQSLIVYLQQVGRVLRVKVDGSRATILDHVGNVFRFGLPDEPREWTLENRKARQAITPVATCPSCYLAHRAAPRCPGCGHIYATARTAGAARTIEAKAGELVEARAEREKQLAAQQLKLKLKAARTHAEFEAIRIEQGYKPGWTENQLRFRGKYAARFGRKGRAA